MDSGGVWRIARSIQLVQGLRRSCRGDMLLLSLFMEIHVSVAKINIDGIVAPEFEGVRDAFEENFTIGGG